MPDTESNSLPIALRLLEFALAPDPPEEDPEMIEEAEEEEEAELDELDAKLRYSATRWSDKRSLNAAMR